MKKERFSFIELSWMNSFVFEASCMIAFMAVLWAPPVAWDVFVAECVDTHAANLCYVVSGVVLCGVLSLLAFKLESKYDNYCMNVELKVNISYIEKPYHPLKK